MTMENSNLISEILVIVLRMKRDMKAMKDEIFSLKSVVRDQATLNGRLLQALEQKEDEQPATEPSSSNKLGRYIKHPRMKYCDKKANVEKFKKCGFSWRTFVNMLNKHREKVKLPELTPEEIESRIDHAKTICAPVVLYYKIQYSLPHDILWSHDSVKVIYKKMYRKLEDEMGSLFPLEFCNGNWAAHVMLAKHWQNVEQSTKRKQKAARIKGQFGNESNYISTENTDVVDPSQIERYEELADGEDEEDGHLEDSEIQEDPEDDKLQDVEPSKVTNGHDEYGDASFDESSDDHDYYDNDLDESSDEHDGLDQVYGEDERYDDSSDEEDQDYEEKSLQLKRRAVKEVSYEELDPSLQEVVDRMEAEKGKVASCSESTAREGSPETAALKVAFEAAACKAAPKTTSKAALKKTGTGDKATNQTGKRKATPVQIKERPKRQCTKK
ncbi:hypothetical protein BJV82DRAFT_603566 [Fennellomyces sp. T-0311]|nr:hypothetical protein BJV82DRAFT_603566 [Fennellomyces sp. T-0311]